MTSYSEDFMKFCEYANVLVGKEIKKPDKHIVLVTDIKDPKSIVNYVCNTLTKNKLLNSGKQKGYIYHNYEFLPDLPNEGLLDFYHEAFLIEEGKDIGLPAIVFVDISGCVDYLDSYELRTFLSFIRQNQNHTLFVLIIDATLSSEINRVGRRIERAIPFEVCCFKKKKTYAA